MEKEPGLLLQREKIFSIDYASGKLTYIPGEGPEDAILPEPIYLQPGKGLWAVDRGEDWQSWRLLGFDGNGHIRANVNLVQNLKIKNPETFSVEKMKLNANGQIYLAASLDYDFKQKKSYEKRIFVISPDGDLLSEKKYPDFQSCGHLFIMNENTLLTLDCPDTGDSAWFWYYSDQNMKKGLVSNYGFSVAVSNRVIERTHAKEFRLLSEEKGAGKLGYKGEDSLGQEPVRGEGHYFGFIKSELKNYEDFEKEKIWETTRELEILFWDEKNECVIKLGRVPIAPGQLNATDWGDFTHYRQGQSCFDDQGNFYEIAWSPKDLTVYVYKLDTKRAAKLLKQAR